VRAALLVAVPAVVLAAPWHVKSWVETGNPVYPFLFDVFGGPEWSPRLAEELRRLAVETAPGRGVVDYLLLPWRLAVSGISAGDPFAGRLHPLWLAAAPLAIVGARRSAAARIALAAAAIFVAGWSLGPQQARFLIPALPLVAIAAGLGVEALVAGERRVSRRGAAAVAAGALLVWAMRPHAVQALGRLRQIEAHGARLEELVVPPALRYLNRETPPDARVLFLNTNKAFFAQREVLADSAFQASQIADWLRPAKTVAEVEAQLRQARVTHVLVERVDWGIEYPPALLAFLADPARCRPVFVSAEGRYVVFALRMS
jgi:hypothetical protein